MIIYGTGYKNSITNKKPIDLLFQLSIPAVMTITFFQSIGNGKKAGTIVMLRQLFLFVPAMIFLPMVFRIKAVWFTQPLVDFIMIVVGILMMIGELNKMGQEKLKF